MLMEFLCTYPNAHLRFLSSNMQLSIDSDAAYLVMMGAKSHIAGYFYIASTANPLNYNGTLHNTPVHRECIILKHIVYLAAEAECDGLFHNAQTATVLRCILAALGHQQKATV
eukprot:13572802-Ditylum_brightwellii.AAC.1